MMTLRDAQEEAVRRWRIHGGWAGSWAPEGVLIYEHAVGIRVPDTLGNRKLLLGHGKTFEAAFASAERRLKRDRERRPRKLAKPGALPMAGDLFTFLAAEAAGKAEGKK